MSVRIICTSSILLCQVWSQKSILFVYANGEMFMYSVMEICALHPQYRYIEWHFIIRRRKIVYRLPIWTSHTCMFILPYASTRFVRQILLWNEAIKLLSCSPVIHELLIAGLEKYDISLRFASLRFILFMLKDIVHESLCGNTVHIEKTCLCLHWHVLTRS
jgi:hypothetical protein